MYLPTHQCASWSGLKRAGTGQYEVHVDISIKRRRPVTTSKFPDTKTEFEFDSQQSASLHNVEVLLLTLQCTHIFITSSRPLSYGAK